MAKKAKEEIEEKTVYVVEDSEKKAVMELIEMYKQGFVDGYVMCKGSRYTKRMYANEIKPALSKNMLKRFYGVGDVKK